MNPLESLRDLGPGAPPPPGAEERVFERVLIATSPVALPTLESSPHAAGSHSGMLGTAIWKSKPMAMFGAWLLGGVTGAAVYAVVREPEVRVEYRQSSAVNAKEMPVHTLPPQELRLPVQAPGLKVSAVVPQASDLAPPATETPPAKLSEQRSQSLLALERALLDDARAQSAAGSPEAVLKSADLHRQRFPDGKLAEEREALAIHALLKLGRREDARARAQAFQAQFPHSLLNSAIEPALAP